MRRWYDYQRERFPLLAHGPLIAAFALSAVTFSALLRGGSPSWQSAIVAFVVSLLLFFQLRVADEFKDAEEDAAHRPYRPVPRGLVTLRELGFLFAACVIIQAAVTAWLDLRLVAVLVVVWAYLAAMCAEFAVRPWLKARPVVYMATHMLILPTADLFATACDWLPRGGWSAAPAGLVPFLAASLANGFVIEIGRKLRSPGDEEQGVETYSAIWGPRRAATAWAAAVLASLALALIAAWRVGWFVGAAVILIPLSLGAASLATRYARDPTRRNAKVIEPISAIWTLAMYLSLGPVPWAWRLLS